MSPELQESLHATGGQRALYMALLGAIRANPEPKSAVRAALQSVEREHVLQLNRRDTPEAGLRGLQDMHESLKAFLAGEFP